MLEMLLIFCLLLAGACGKRDKKSNPPSINEEASAQLALYAELSSGMGWVSDKCDSLGFTSLCKVYGGCAAANIYDAEVNGRWYRDPSKDCLQTKGSKSDMSRDHLLMLMTYMESLAHTDQPQALATLERMRAYLEKNNWVSGDSDGSVDGVNRVLALSLAPLLIDLIKHVKGLPVVRPEAKLTAGEGDVIYAKRDYEAHLDVLSIRLKGIVYGSITGAEKDALKEHAFRVPANALFRAVYAKYSDGNYAGAWDALRTGGHCPSNRLPTTSDRCGDYVYQREPSSTAWVPCPEKVAVHAGNDCGMALKVITGG
jgi:hypothetical protein